MKRTIVTIAALAATNLATAGYIIWHARPAEIFVDHLEDLRLAKADGNMHARLGDSRTRSSVTLVFTPHGAIQLHSELGRMFALIEKKAGEAPRDQPAKPESLRPSL